MPNAVVPIDRNAGGLPVADTISAGGSVKKSYGYGVSPTDEVVTSTPSKPITRLPKKAEVEPKQQEPRNPTWDKVADGGRKAAWGAGAVLTGTTGVLAASAATGLSSGMLGPTIFLSVLGPAALVAAAGLAAYGIGKLMNRGKQPADVPAEPKPQGTWAKIKNLGRKVAKAGVLITAGCLAAGIAAPLAVAPVILGAAAYVGPAVAAAGAAAWAAGKIKE